MEKLIDVTSENNVVLDVGCGFSPRHHVKKGNVGIDLKKGLCDVVASAYYLPFRVQMFQKVVMSHILEHLLNVEQALTEVKRVLKPEGILEIEVPNPSTFGIFKDYVFSRKAKLGSVGCSKDHVCAFGEAELQNLMRETKFHPVKIEYVHSSVAKKHMEESGLFKKIFYKVLFGLFPAFRTALKVIAYKNEVRLQAHKHCPKHF